MTKYHNALHIACGRAPQTPLSAKILKCGGGAADVVGGAAGSEVLQDWKKRFVASAGAFQMVPRLLFNELS